MKMRMEDTWLYQEGVEEARRQSMEPLREAALELCRLRFGADENALERIRQIGEPDLLIRLMVRLGTAASLPEALSLLPASDPTAGGQVSA